MKAFRKALSILFLLLVCMYATNAEPCDSGTYDAQYQSLYSQDTTSDESVPAHHASDCAHHICCVILPSLAKFQLPMHLTKKIPFTPVLCNLSESEPPFRPPIVV